jgi:membrane protease YdiL (CAAX protease family)
VASVQDWWSVELPEWWHYLGAAGPIGAALLTAALTEGRSGLRKLLAQYSPSRASGRWLAFAVLSPLALLGLGMVLARAIDGAWPSFADLSHTDNLPAMALPFTLLVHVLSFGLGEETGWRGYALPKLQAGRTAIAATHILALAWGFWHLPTFFENESFREMGALEILGWSAGLWMGAVFLTWLYNSSGGSLLVVVVWHGLFNQFSASEASSIVPAVLSMGVILIALAALKLAGPAELTGLSRNAGERQRWNWQPAAIERPAIQRREAR